MFVSNPFRAEEEAGISRLDGMATAEERLQTLNAVRLVSERMTVDVEEAPCSLVLCVTANNPFPTVYLCSSL